MMNHELPKTKSGKVRCDRTGCQRMATHLFREEMHRNHPGIISRVCESHLAQVKVIEIWQSNPTGFASKPEKCGTWGWSQNYARWEERENREAYR